MKFKSLKIGKKFIFPLDATEFVEQENYTTPRPIDVYIKIDARSSITLKGEFYPCMPSDAVILLNF